MNDALCLLNLMLRKQSGMVVLKHSITSILSKLATINMFSDVFRFLVIFLLMRACWDIIIYAGI